MKDFFTRRRGYTGVGERQSHRLIGLHGCQRAAGGQTAATNTKQRGGVMKSCFLRAHHDLQRFAVALGRRGGALVGTGFTCFLSSRVFKATSVPCISWVLVYLLGSVTTTRTKLQHQPNPRYHKKYRSIPHPLFPAKTVCLDVRTELYPSRRPSQQDNMFLKRPARR